MARPGINVWRCRGRAPSNLERLPCPVQVQNQRTHPTFGPHIASLQYTLAALQPPDSL